MSLSYIIILLRAFSHATLNSFRESRDKLEAADIFIESAINGTDTGPKAL